jgi:hypothetical protein
MILLTGVLALGVVLYLTRGRSAPPPAGEVLGGGQATPTAVPYEPGAPAEATAGPALAATPSPTSSALLLPARTPAVTPRSEAGGVVVPLEPTPTPTPIPRPPTATPTPPIVAVFKAREKVKFGVSPEEAHVIINGHDIGIADDWDDMGGGKSWRFPSVPGVYWVRFELKGYRSTWIKIIADPDAKDKTAEVDTELKKAKHHHEDDTKDDD